MPALLGASVDLCGSAKAPCDPEVLRSGGKHPRWELWLEEGLSPG